MRIFKNLEKFLKIERQSCISLSALIKLKKNYKHCKQISRKFKKTYLLDCLLMQIKREYKVFYNYITCT